MTVPIPKHGRVFDKSLSEPDTQSDVYRPAQGILVGLCMGSAIWGLIIWALI